MAARKKKRPAKRPEQRLVRVQRGDDGLTPALLDALVRSIVDSKLPRKFAATTNGVSPDTFELWVSMGAGGQGTELHTELARKVYGAEGAIVGQQMQNLCTLGMEDATAATSFLKLFKPKDFGGVVPVADEFKDPARNAQRQDVLLDNPPPRMLAKFREHGWWRFHGDLDEEDRMVLIALQDKYRERPPSPSSTAEATLPEAGT